MKLVKINPNNMSYYSRHFIKGFECGAKRQLEADKRSIPKGHWIDISVDDPLCIPRHKCSVCGIKSYTFKFCPDCGADMRGEDDD